MTILNKRVRRAFMLSLALFFGSFAIAQQKAQEIKRDIEAQQYVFHAQNALPLSGSSRPLTPEYDLKISPNSVESYLPFFGRVYSLPADPTKGGFDFTSTKFKYDVKEGKKGGWEISIKPTDVTDFREFSLSISQNGYGTLQALSNNRQPISFTGYISGTQ